MMNSKANKREVASADGSLPSLMLAAKGLMQMTNLESNSNMKGMTDDFVQILTIQLTKGSENGLGFSIVDQETTPGIFVAHIVDDSQARQAGLKVNDQIQSVNEESFESLDQATAAVILKSLPFGPVSLKIRRSRDVLVVRTLQQFILQLQDDPRITQAVNEKWRNAAALQQNYSAAPTAGSGGSRQDSTEAADVDGNVEAVPGDGSKNGKGHPVSAAPSLIEQQRLHFQRVFRNRDLFPQSTQTRFKGCLFQFLFVMEIIIGLTVLILECVTAGMFWKHIYGAEYAGIYVGLFATIAGSIGLWICMITVPLEKEQTFYWVNLGLQCMCVVNSVALLGAGIALFLRHKAEGKKNLLGNSEVKDGYLVPLIKLKTAGFIFHIFLIIFALTLLTMIIIRRRRKQDGEKGKKKSKA